MAALQGRLAYRWVFTCVTHGKHCRLASATSRYLSCGNIFLRVVLGRPEPDLPPCSKQYEQQQVCLLSIFTGSYAYAFTPGLRLAWRPSARQISRNHGVWMPGEPQPEPQPDPNRPLPPRRTPVVMPTVGEGRDQMDVMSRLLKDRILLLGQEVNDEVGNVLVAQLLYLANNDPEKDITLYINSPGGSVSAGLAIYDTMQFIPCELTPVAIDWGR
ncbi:unnamed protein product [Ascophyllum nodosum]